MREEEKDRRKVEEWEGRLNKLKVAVLRMIQPSTIAYGELKKEKTIDQREEIGLRAEKKKSGVKISS